MTPAGADIEDCNKRVSDLKELVASPSDSALSAEDGQETDEQKRDTTKDCVELVQPLCIDLWLRLVELSLDDRPADRVDDRLDENDSSCPSMQEVEVLVWNPGEHCEDTLTCAEQHRERRKSIRENTDTVGESSQPTARVVVVGVFDRSDPCLINDANESSELLADRTWKVIHLVKMTYEKIKRYPSMMAKMATCSLVTRPKMDLNGVSTNNHLLFMRSALLQQASIRPPTRCAGPPIRQPRSVTQTTAIPSKTPHMMNEYIMETSCIQ